MNMYSMPGYFQNMPTVGKALVNPNPENEQELKAVENDIHESIKQALDAGITTEEKLNARGQLSATQRIGHDRNHRYMVHVKQPLQSGRQPFPDN